MQAKILWVDDEIDLLKPHILFLEGKGYSVETINNGGEAIELCAQNHYDLVLLDENMPGISGLVALEKIKEFRPDLPIVMVTKSEEESIMEDAIGRKIADYLIKPVHPNQLLLSLKKNLEHEKIVSQTVNHNYQQEFRQLANRINECDTIEDWIAIFQKIVFWELELQKIQDSGMKEILISQKKEANDLFCRFVEDNYEYWLKNKSEAPEMLHTVLKNRVFNQFSEEKVFLLVVDNLRYDQWQVLKPIFSKYFQVDKEEVIFSILPTATHYARNAFFAGLMPSEIQQLHPSWWLNEEEEGGKNQFEKELLEANLKRNGKQVKLSYTKITNLEAGKKYIDQFNQLKNYDFNVLVYNFVDMLSHARTEMNIIKELADDEAAYRSLTLSWFEHSPLLEIIQKVSQQGFKLIVTTDHGSVRVNNPIKIIGERSTNTNLRYKVGKNLTYKEKEVFTVKDPKQIFLPKANVSSEFVFAREADFFVYPNNYNHFVNHYEDTFQHGGLSLEEICIPFVELKPKKK
jgi:CheY-like chemotaxis protein